MYESGVSRGFWKPNVAHQPAKLTQLNSTLRTITHVFEQDSPFHDTFTDFREIEIQYARLFISNLSENPRPLGRG